MKPMIRGMLEALATVIPAAPSKIERWRIIIAALEGLGHMPVRLLVATESKRTEAGLRAMAIDDNVVGFMADRLAKHGIKVSGRNLGAFMDAALVDRDFIHGTICFCKYNAALIVPASIVVERIKNSLAIDANN